MNEPIALKQCCYSAGPGPELRKKVSGVEVIESRLRQQRNSWIPIPINLLGVEHVDLRVDVRVAAWTLN